jgi:hypothetical protein
MIRCTKLDVRPLVARCDGALGRLYRRTGAGDQAETHLTTASTMCAEMGMRASLEQLERG